MKRILLSICLALIVAIILVNCLGFLAPAHMILSRFDTDATVNETFLAQSRLQKEKWYVLTHTDVQGDTATIARELFGGYRMTRNGDSFDIQTTDGGGTSATYGRDFDHRTDHKGRPSDQSCYTSGAYYGDYPGYDIIDISINPTVGEALSNQRLQTLSFEYDSKGNFTRQTRTLPDGSYTYLLYTYEEDRLTKIEEYDMADNLTAYTLMEYEADSRTATRHTADGTAAGSEVDQYGWFGRLEKTEYYDAQGELTAWDVYSYQPWQLLLSWKGVCVGIAIAALSLYCGLELNRWLKTRSQPQA